MHERINCFLHILQVYLTSLSIGYSLNTSELTSMVTFVQAVCEGTLYCVVTSWCYHVNQQPFNLKTLYNTDPRIMKIWVFQKIPQLKKLRLHFTTSIFLLNNCVIVCVCGRRGFFFSRISGCCSLYFQWDVLSSLWAKGFFVYLSCSYFTFFSFIFAFNFEFFSRWC